MKKVMRFAMARFKIATRVIINLSSNTCGAAPAARAPGLTYKKKTSLSHLSSYFVHVFKKEDHKPKETFGHRRSMIHVLQFVDTARERDLWASQAHRLCFVTREAESGSMTHTLLIGKFACKHSGAY
jgi:hypothetical protein